MFVSPRQPESEQPAAGRGRALGGSRTFRGGRGGRIHGLLPKGQVWFCAFVGDRGPGMVMGNLVRRFQGWENKKDNSKLIEHSPREGRENLSHLYEGGVSGFRHSFVDFGGHSLALN